MDSGQILFLLGLFAAVPVGIATNLLTPRVGDWWGRYSDKRAAANVKHAGRARQQAMALVDRPDLLTLIMVRALMRMVLYGSVTILLIVTAAVVVQTGSPFYSVVGVGVNMDPQTTRFIIALLVELYAIWAIILIARTYLRAAFLHRRVARLRIELNGWEASHTSSDEPVGDAT